MRPNQVAIVVTAAVAALAFAAALIGVPVPLLAVLGLASIAAPGYVWGEVLFGSRAGSLAAGLERVAVAAGISLAVPVLGGVALNAAGVPLHRTAWASLFAGVTLAGDIALLIRSRDDSERAPGGRRAPGGQAAGRRSLARRVPVWPALAFGAAAVIAVGAVWLAHAGAARQQYPGYTELWFSPPDYNASTVRLGVTNRQGAQTGYQLVLRRAGRVSGSWTFTLANGRTWRRTLSFNGIGGIAADLYRAPDLSHPYRHVNIAPFLSGSS